jgi:hypothetical protein
MKTRRRAARGFEPLGQPLDAVGVLGMDHGHRAVAPCDVQHVEHLPVVQLEVVVGHVDLERGVALGDQGRQLLLQHLRGRVADDQVEGVVDMGLAFGAGVVVLDSRAQRLALGLRRERDHRRRTAASGRTRAALEAVGHLRRAFHGLVQVAVRVHATGRHHAACGVDLLRGAIQARAQLHDAAALDADVAVEGVAGGGDTGIADDEVKGHVGPPRAPARDG